MGREETDTASQAREFNGVPTHKPKGTKIMFTEINDKIYLDNQSMTVLVADAVKHHVQSQDVLIMSPSIAKLTSEDLVETFKKDWRRPQDGSNKDLQDMYRSVPEALEWAAEREHDRRADIEETDKYRAFLDAVFNPELDDELYDYDDEDLF